MKALPHNIETEKAVIWTMLSFPETVAEGIEAADFYNPQCRTLFTAIKDIKENGASPDIITVYEKVKDKGISIPELTAITEGIYSSDKISSYITSLKECTRKREAIRIGIEIQELANGNPETMRALWEKLMQASQIGSCKDSSVSFDDVNSAYEMVMGRLGKSLYGYSWGKSLAFLDEITNWLVKKRVYRIGATSNTGKTQLVYNLLPSLLEQKNEDGTYVKVAFFTLENTREDTLVSIMCNYAGLDAKKLNKGEVEGEWDYLTKLKNRLFIIDDVYEVDKIFSKILQIKPDVVVLDYISHVSYSKGRDLEKYDYYAEQVPKFAKQNNLVWLDLSNLPKNLQTQELIRATPGFHWSSLLMNNCDVAIHLMKNESFQKAKESVQEFWTVADRAYFRNRAVIDLLFTKNRWGSVFVQNTYWLNFWEGGRWKELTEDALKPLIEKYVWK